MNIVLRDKSFRRNFEGKMRVRGALIPKWTTGRAKNATARCHPSVAPSIPSKGRSTLSSKLCTRISFWKIFKLPKTNSKLSKMRMMVTLQQTRQMGRNTFVRVVRTLKTIKMRLHSSRLSSSIISTSRRTPRNCASICFS